jgi:uncharacterized protein
LLQLAISPDLLAEVERVMSHPKLGFDQVKIERFIRQLLRHALIVEPQHQLDIITADDSDNRVLECAVATNAAWIVSGDKHLLSIGSFNDIQIMTTSEALRLLDSEPG